MSIVAEVVLGLAAFARIHARVTSGRLVRIQSWYLRAGLFLLPLAYSWGTYDHYVLPDIWFPVSYSVPNGPASQGLALYVPGSGIYWMSSLQVQLAGACS